MGEDFPMFRAGLVLLAVIAVAGLSYSVVSGETPWWRESGAPVVVAHARDGSGGARGTAAPECRIVGRPQPIRADVPESSGVARSGRTQGVYWTHNDSGEPQIFAVGVDGADRGRVRVSGAQVDDWEDIASAPCEGGHCLYIADIGDNGGKRDSITVYRVPEPAPGEAETRVAEALHARYPDGAQDAEALLVTPAGQVYVVTKGENGPVALYRFPKATEPGRAVTLERVHRFTEEKVDRDARVTGGAVSPDGRWAAVRTVNALSLEPLEDFLAGRSGMLHHVDLSALGEPQGEGVAFDGDGGVVLTSEAGSVLGPSILTRLKCSL